MNRLILGYSLTLLPIILIASIANEVLVVQWLGGFEAYAGPESRPPIWSIGTARGLQNWVIGLGFTALYLYPVLLASKTVKMPYPLFLFLLAWLPFLVIAELTTSYYMFVEYVVPLTAMIVVFWYFTRSYHA